MPEGRTRVVAHLFALADGVLPDAAQPRRRYLVPGRIEVFGKHTDYAGGRSLLCAVDRGLAVVAASRSDRRIRIVDASRSLQAAMSLDPGLSRARNWTTYPRVVARRLAHDFGPDLCGADIAFASDLPTAAGLSSSSALVVAVFTVLAGVNALGDRPAFRANIRSDDDLAAYLGALENGLPFAGLAGERGVGTAGGCEDQAAILRARRDHLSQYAFLPLRHERDVSMPPGHVFAVGVSGRSAVKTGNAMERYNRMSRMTAVMRDLWNQATNRRDRSLGEALASAPDAQTRMRATLEAGQSEFTAAELTARLEQFATESNELVPAAADALADGDLDAFGTLADRSQRGAEEALGNQVPETITLQRSARALGARAASAFGAGFGGSVWALVQREQAGEFLERWQAAYAEAHPGLAKGARFFVTDAAPGLLRLDATRPGWPRAS